LILLPIFSAGLHLHSARSRQNIAIGDQSRETTPAFFGVKPSWKADASQKKHLTYRHFKNPESLTRPDSFLPNTAAYFQLHLCQPDSKFPHQNRDTGRWNKNGIAERKS
jgi:hypothetical protein